jgi:hypothetical protein
VESLLGFLEVAPVSKSEPDDTGLVVVELDCSATVELGLGLGASVVVDVGSDRDNVSTSAVGWDEGVTVVVGRALVVLVQGNDRV